MNKVRRNTLEPLLIYYDGDKGLWETRILTVGSVVKFFPDSEGGYGFIQTPNVQGDIYFHMDKARSMKPIKTRTNTWLPRFDVTNNHVGKPATGDLLVLIVQKKVDRFRAAVWSTIGCYKRALNESHCKVNPNTQQPRYRAYPADKVDGSYNEGSIEQLLQFFPKWNFTRFQILSEGIWVDCEDPKPPKHS